MTAPATHPEPDAAPAGTGGRAGRAGRAGLGLFLGGFAVRAQHFAIGPLLPFMQAELPLSHSIAGLLATIPILGTSLFAIPAPFVERRLGARAAIGACIGVLGLFGIARALAPGEDWIILLTVPLGAGMGIGGALLPVIVKEHFADRPAMATGRYTNGFQLGAALVAGGAAPLAIFLGGWRASLAAISLGTIALALLWLALVPPVERSATPPPRARWPLASGLAWLAAILFGLRSFVFQGLSAWLPSIYVDLGWSEVLAGLLVLVLVGVATPVTIVSMRIADRTGGRSGFLIGASLLMVASIGGLLVLPSLGLAWVIGIGGSLGILFPLTMTLPLDISPDPRAAAAASSMVFFVGYLIAAASPVVLGAIRDATGSFSGSLAALLGIAVAMLALTLRMTRHVPSRGGRPTGDAIDEGGPAG